MTIAPALGLPHDHDLALRHRYGDEAAFDEVFATYRDMVYNLALRLIADPAAAEDVTQDVFLRVYRHLGRFRGGSSLKTWIYRIALNRCRSRFARRRLPLVGLETAEGRARPLADPARSPEERALANDAQRRLARALARVPAPFREAVVLRDVEGLTYEEIAVVVGRRVGTVRSRIARGRQRLREILEEEERA